MKKLFAFLFLSISYLLISNTSVFADCVGQYGQYGQPCPSYAIVVDKMVGKPGASNDATTYEYVDNLSATDPRFRPDQVVFFKIKKARTNNCRLLYHDAFSRNTYLE